MSPAIRWSIIPLAAVAVAGCDGGTAGQGTIGDNRIQVRGVGSVAAPPDIATVEVGVRTFAPNAEAAVAENNRRAAAVAAALKAQGIAEEDIRTTKFNVFPKREYVRDGPDTLSGYGASNSVSATVRDLAAVGAVLQATVEAGANNVRGLSFGIADEEVVMNRARVRAVKDARKRAATFAEAAGVKLGRVISIREMQGSQRQGRHRFEMESSAQSVPVQPGELKMDAVAEVVFAIR